MPLLTSPIDGSPMRQIHRYGIEIDVCPTSGGIWLDKGELEKLMHLLREEAVAEQSDFENRARARNVDGRDYDDRGRHGQKFDYSSGQYKKKDNKMSRIMDLFDF